jgi:hypothetical protein
MKIESNAWRSVCLGVLTVCGVLPAARAVDVVHLTNGKAIQAVDIQWRESEQSYRVSTPDGVIMPVPKSQVERLEIARPPAFAQAETMMGARQFAAAVPILDEIVSKYTMRVWDGEARKLLAQAHLALNDPKKAADALSGYMSGIPKADIPAETILLYWRALLAAGRGSTLKKELDDVIVSGTRPMAAAAMVMRGNMNREAGQKEVAVLDYLRVVILFENVKSVQPEALFKAAELLEEMRDSRADELKKRLVQEYRDRDYAAKLSGKI